MVSRLLNTKTLSFYLDNLKIVVEKTKMKYIILQYFFLVHFCNIKISLTSSRHRSKGLNYEIDSYTNQGLKAARNESDIRNRYERIQETDANKSKSVKENDKNEHVKINKGFSDKIDIQAVMNDTILLSENLKLNYEYLTQKALEENGRSNSEMVTKSDVEDQSKESNIEESDNEDLVRTIKGHIKHNWKKKSINENQRSQDNAKDNDRKKDHSRYSETIYSDHSGADDERHEKSEKKHLLLEEERYEDINSRETQNPELKVKTTVNQDQEESHNNKETEEILSSISKENNKTPISEDKNIELSITDELGTEENIEDENVDAQISNEHRNQKNIVILDDNPYGGVKNIKFDNSDDQKSQEWSREITKNHENKGPNNPVIRKEGGKLYTYVKDSDYDDYHEELAEWRKKHPEKNPADFI